MQNPTKMPPQKLKGNFSVVEQVKSRVGKGDGREYEGDDDKSGGNTKSFTSQSNVVENDPVAAETATG